MTQNNPHIQEQGQLIMIVGPMFSGKSTKLLEYVYDSKLPVKCFNSHLDNRYKENSISTHNDQHYPSTVYSKEAVTISLSPTLYAFEEIQFYPESFLDISLELYNLGHTVVCAGLNKDCFNNKYRIVEELSKAATTIFHLEAKCNVCGSPASNSQLLSGKNLDIEHPVVIGSNGVYEARCNKCYKIGE